ncbi:NFACT RNA binding domain-containing protein [Nitratifractor sp.]
MITRAHLVALARYLGRFHHIKKARRVENNVIELNFGEEESLFFDMTRGRSSIYLAPSRRPTNDFSAPFDTLLHQLLAFGRLVEATVEPGDRVLILRVRPRSRYKNREVALRLEFTGRRSNAILVDEHGIVLEALRHIDAAQSYRVVRPGVELAPLPPAPRQEGDHAIDEATLLEWLRRNAQTIREERLKRLKEVKSRQIERKIATIREALSRLPREEQLRREAEEMRNYGAIVLANLHTLRPYDTVLHTRDFEGNEVTIPLPQGVPINRMGEYFYRQASRAEAKARHVHLEERNLREKLRFYENVRDAIEHSQDPHELEILVPKKGRSRRKKEKLRHGELYWIEGYKVLMGRNARENQKLLEEARANDIWMHVRDLPGSHVIIRTDKQNLPPSVLEAAARLCVDFTTPNPGNYAVDYTRRKFVKIQEGSRVEYDKYKTIPVLKEGIEIRE